MKAQPARSRKRNAGRSQGLSLLALESRRLLAGAGFDSASGEVLVVGTERKDTVVITKSGGSIVVSQSGFENQTFSASRVKGLRFIGLGGDDRFENKTSVPSKAFGGDGNDLLIGGSSNDRLAGNDGNDRVFAGDGDDILVGGNGTDRLDAGDGKDRVYGISGTNTMNGGSGDDLMLGGSGSDRIDGGSGDDAIYANQGNDNIKGGSGDDVIGGNVGDDVIDGGTGDDKIYAGAGDDSVRDSSGANLLVGAGGDDKLSGGSGADRIFGGDGADSIQGWDGDDRIAGQDGSDSIWGGKGNDLLYGNSGRDRVFGGIGNDRLFGLSGDDLLRGGSGNDSLHGGDGNDNLYGEGGTDKLFGEAGLDGLFGGRGGSDRLTGGTGADRFLIHSNDIREDFRASADVRLIFTDSSSKWTNKEIEVVDRGLGELHRRTKGVRVLRNTLDKNPLSFHKVNRTSSGNPAQNQLQMSYIRNERTGRLIPGSEEFTRKIVFAEWSEGDALENEFRASAAIHEVSHNWDSEREINSVLPGQGKIWKDFLAQSNWRTSKPSSSSFSKARGTTFEPFEIQFDPASKNYRQIPKTWWYRSSAKFARSYGSTNPLEDWGTMWEEALSDSPDSSLKGKLAIVNRFLSRI